MKVPKDSTVKYIFDKLCLENNIEFVVKGGNYVSSINGLAEFDNGKFSGWVYSVNGEYPDKTYDKVTVKNGDAIVFRYTDNYKKDNIPMGEDDNQGGTGGSGGAGEAGGTGGTTGGSGEAGGTAGTPVTPGTSESTGEGSKPSGDVVRVETVQGEEVEDVPVAVEGNIKPSSKLVVTKVAEDKMPEAFKKAEKEAKAANASLIKFFEVKLIDGGKELHNTGKVTVEFSVGKAYEGYKAVVKHQLHDGTIEEMQAKVVDGKVRVNASSLSPFMVALSKDDSLTNSDASAHADKSKVVANKENAKKAGKSAFTGDETNAFGFMALAGIAMVLVAVLRRKVNR